MTSPAPVLLRVLRPDVPRPEAIPSSLTRWRIGGVEVVCRVWSPGEFAALPRLDRAIVTRAGAQLLPDGSRHLLLEGPG